MIDQCRVLNSLQLSGVDSIVLPCLPKTHTRDLTSDGDLAWKQGFHTCNYLRSHWRIGTLTQNDWHLYKKGYGKWSWQMSCENG